MVTNLPPEAKSKWFEVTLTKNPEEKLQLMGEFLSLVPKHKGTERMCSQVKKQMAAIREEIEEKKQQKKGSGLSTFIPKAGAAQIAIIGPTNVGRSNLLRAITKAQVEVTPYPFGTIFPIPGMLYYKDIQFQLVEIPPIVCGSSEGKADGYTNLSMIRNADGIIIVIALNENPSGNLQNILRELGNSRILTTPPSGDVEIEKRGYGKGIQYIWEGELLNTTPEEVTTLLNDYKIKSALVRIKGKVNLDTVEDALFGNTVYLPTLVFVNKADLGVDPVTLDQLRWSAGQMEIIIASAEKTVNLQSIIGEKLFRMLNIARIYTKEPGKEPNKTPMIAHNGITVAELAKMIHNDFYNHFKYARIWGPSAKFPSERVGLDRHLIDGTIVEIRA